MATLGSKTNGELCPCALLSNSFLHYYFLEIFQKFIIILPITIMSIRKLCYNETTPFQYKPLTDIKKRLVRRRKKITYI